MNDMILKIIEANNSDLEKRKREMPVEKSKGETSSFFNAFKDFGVIAEIKLKSPSSGMLADKSKVSEFANKYKLGGARAISIITEKYFFDGDISFIPEVKKITGLPVLQKDFVVDKYQILESKKSGADAVLLIAKIVTQEELMRFVELCFEVGIEPVVEINDEEDLKKALKTRTRIIAVNARNLDTFKINLSKACKLIEKIPNEYLKLGFSGVNSRDEVLKYRSCGAKGVLIGTQLMRAEDKKRFLEDLK